MVITFFIAIIIQYQKRRQQHLLEVQNLEHQFSQTLLSSQIEIQEQTLRNISQELHDNISQKLGLAKLQLNLIQTNQPTVNVSETKTVIMEAIADIRALSKSMHPDRIATIPLKESIEHEISLLQNVSTASVHCIIEADSEIHTPEQRIILFRIFQELLNNALKYSQATRVDIMLSTNDQIILSVVDNVICFVVVLLVARSL
jgi:signal transduction histidine kinase